MHSVPGSAKSTLHTPPSLQFASMMHGGCAWQLELQSGKRHKPSVGLHTPPRSAQRSRVAQPLAVQIGSRHATRVVHAEVSGEGSHAPVEGLHACRAQPLPPQSIGVDTQPWPGTQLALSHGPGSHASGLSCTHAPLARSQRSVPLQGS
jgi:hypothetical protein